MKKLITLALAMLLCVGAVATAEPSKSTADMTTVTEVKTETGVAVRMTLSSRLSPITM